MIGESAIAGKPTPVKVRVLAGGLLSAAHVRSKVDARIIELIKKYLACTMHPSTPEGNARSVWQVARRAHLSESIYSHQIYHS